RVCEPRRFTCRPPNIFPAMPFAQPAISSSAMRERPSSSLRAQDGDDFVVVASNAERAAVDHFGASELLNTIAPLAIEPANISPSEGNSPAKTASISRSWLLRGHVTASVCGGFFAALSRLAARCSRHIGNPPPSGMLPGEVMP